MNTSGSSRCATFLQGKSLLTTTTCTTETRTTRRSATVVPKTAEAVCTGKKRSNDVPKQRNRRPLGPRNENAGRSISHTGTRALYADRACGVPRVGGLRREFIRTSRQQRRRHSTATRLQ